MKTILTLWLFLSLTIISAQVGIGTDDPEESSILDLKSNSQGFLPSRLTVAQRDAITNPAEGLMVFVNDTQCAHQNGVHFYNGASWIYLAKGSPAVYTNLFINQVFNGTAPTSAQVNGIVTGINATISTRWGAAHHLFDGSTSTEGIHMYRATSTEDWGISTAMLCTYRITGIELQARNRHRSRINNIVLSLWLDNVEVWNSGSPITGVPNNQTLTFTIPNGVLANELRLLVPNGGNATNDGQGHYINPGEITITGATAF